MTWQLWTAWGVLYGFGIIVGYVYKKHRAATILLSAGILVQLYGLFR